MSKKKKYQISAVIFIAAFAASLVPSSLIDAGSWTNADPANGHYMSIVESLLHNLPPAVVVGLVAVGLFLFAVFFAGKAKEWIEEGAALESGNGKEKV